MLLTDPLIRLRADFLDGSAAMLSLNLVVAFLKPLTAILNSLLSFLMQFVAACKVRSRPTTLAFCGARRATQLILTYRCLSLTSSYLRLPTHTGCRAKQGSI